MVSPDEGPSVSAGSGDDTPAREDAYGKRAAREDLYGKRAACEETSGSAPAREEASGSAPAREEAYGPIRFGRYVKGDGRALILYTHGSPQAGGL